MKCPTCGTEYSGDVCPNCGYSNNGNKPKKPLQKRWWFWALIAVVVIAIIGAIVGNGGESNSPQTDPSGQVTEPTSTNQTSKPTETTEATQETTKPTETTEPIETVYELADGHYTAGIDIPIGKCDVIALEGNGNLSSSNLFTGGINEMFGVKDDTGYYTESFTGLKLPEGTVLTVSGGLKVQLTFTSVEGGFSGRTYHEDQAIDLASGNYEAGVDFEAGVYKIVAASGSGNLSSSNIFDGGVNEMFGVDDGSGWYTPEIQNVTLTEGVELTVSGGLTIKLIPATEN